MGTKEKSKRNVRKIAEFSELKASTANEAWAKLQQNRQKRKEEELNANSE